MYLNSNLKDWNSDGGIRIQQRSQTKCFVHAQILLFTSNFENYFMGSSDEILNNLLFIGNILLYF